MISRTRHAINGGGDQAACKLQMEWHWPKFACA
jgi:hypothetical protein